MKRPICVDIDNVVARTDEVIRRLIKEYSRGGVDLAYADVVEFDYYRCVDREGRQLDKSEWPDIHMEFARNHLATIRPFEDVQIHLARLDRVFEIHLVTSRPQVGQEMTRRWLDEHGVPFTELHFVEHRRKHELSLPFVVAIEDDREQAALFQERGIPAVLLAHPWNCLAPASRLIRVAGWPALVDEVLNIAPSGIP